MTDLFSKVARGSLWISAARALVNGLALISTVVLARLLTPEDFGIVAIAVTLLAVVSAMTDLSLAQALIQHENPLRTHFDTVWTLGVLRGTIVGGLYAVSGPLVADIFNDGRLAPVMAVLGGGIFLTGLANPRRIMLQKDLIFWQDFLLKVGEKLVAVIVTVAIALIYRSYWALVWGTIAGQAASVLVSYTIMPYRPKIGFEGARRLFSFSIWLTLGQVMNTVNWRFDQLLLGRFIGKADLGLYSVGDNLAQLPTREATAPLTQTLFPAFAKVAGAPDRLRSVYQSSQALVTAAALPLGVGTALLAHPIVLLTMGPKWLGAVVVIQGLASIFALQTLGSLVQPLGMAVGGTRSLFTRDAIMFAIRIPIITTGLMLGGLVGVVLARIVSGLVAIAFNMSLIKKLIGVSVLEQVLVNRRALVSVSLMVIGVVAVRTVLPDNVDALSLVLTIVGQAAFGAAIYCGASAVQWRLSGRPSGPETAILRVLSSLMKQLTARRINFRGKLS